VKAGVWLSLLLQKFQLLLPTLLVFLLLRRWRVLGGFLAGSIALLVVSLLLVGPSGLESYARLIVEMSGWIERKGIYPSQMHNLRAQFYIWWYGHHPFVANAMTALGSVTLLILLVRNWRGKWNPGSAEFGLKFSLLVTISLLVSPHLNLHDLSCLLLPGLLIAQVSEREAGSASSVRTLRRGTWVVGYPLMLASLVVSGWVPLHLSVWGMIGLVFLLVQSLKRNGGKLEWETGSIAASRQN
jgi:hypothetical protein